MLDQEESEFIRKLSEQEICELREAFNIFDDNSDGRINKDKMLLLLSSLKQKLNKKDYGLLLENVGVGISNEIDFNQFLIMMAKLTKNLNKDDDKYLKNIFNYMDRNNNGKISIQEIRYIVTHSNENISEQEIEFLIKEADSDGDGLISYDEFLIFMKN